MNQPRRRVICHKTHTSRGKQVTQTLSALVKWCKAEKGMYAVGIEFVNLNPEEHLELLRFLARIRQRGQL
jgi:hypothetical protein